MISGRAKSPVGGAWPAKPIDQTVAVRQAASEGGEIYARTVLILD